MSKRQTIRVVQGRSEWEELFRSIDRPHLVQSWAYGEAKKATGWAPRRLVIESGATPVAICQVLVKRPGGIPLVARVNRGPLLLDPDSGDPHVQSVYEALRLNRASRGAAVLLIAPALEEGPQNENEHLLRSAGFRLRRREGWCSAYLDLRLPASQLRTSLSRGWRNHLNRAERGGLKFTSSSSAEDVEWLLDRHDENMRDKNFRGLTRPLLKQLPRSAGQEGFLVCMVRSSDGAPVAGLGALRAADNAEYLVGWYGKEGRESSAGNFLLWNTALELQRRGCLTFDLGGYSSSHETGYGRFKAGMHGTEYRLMGEWYTW